MPDPTSSRRPCRGPSHYCTRCNGPQLPKAKPSVAAKTFTACFMLLCSLGPSHFSGPPGAPRVSTAHGRRCRQELFTGNRTIQTRARGAAVVVGWEVRAIDIGRAPATPGLAVAPREFRLCCGDFRRLGQDAAALEGFVFLFFRCGGLELNFCDCGVVEFGTPHVGTAYATTMVLSFRHARLLASFHTGRAGGGHCICRHAMRGWPGLALARQTQST